MSTLSAARIGDICRQVDMPERAVPTAIATALAASGGIPSYEHLIWPGPSAWYKGLWGLDLCEHEQMLGRPLDNPYEAARAATELVAEWGDWSWCPAYRAGSYAPHLAAAHVAATHSAGPDPIHETVAGPWAARNLAAWHDRFATVRAVLPRPRT